MTAKNVQRLLDIVERLRTPETGCPWDVEQTFATIAPHTIEETYELVEAIENNDPLAIKEELGDVLFQVVFHAQMGREAGLFDFDSVAGYVANKMIERHPHVFGEREVGNAHDVLVNWEKDKAKKRDIAASESGRTPSTLDGVSLALPASTRAIKLQKRAAHVGFDWDNIADVIAKIREEVDELETEIAQKKPKAFLEDELGDVFFALANLARKLSIDPETALRHTNKKFEKRFHRIEEALAKRGKTPVDATLDEMEALWHAAKVKEHKA